MKIKFEDKLKEHLKDNQVDLGEEYEEPIAKQITSILKKIAGNLEIKDNKDRIDISINKEVYLSEDFRTLWDSIKYHTRYSFEFDSDKLIENCIKSINDNIMNRSVKYLFKSGQLNIDASGVSSNEDELKAHMETSEYKAKSIPDIITYLQNETDLTRKTIVQILKSLDKYRIDFLKSNPQSFMEQCIQIINRQKELLMVEGIVYNKIDDNSFYEQNRIENDALSTYLKNELLVESTKSPYVKTVCDSKVESALAKEFENSPQVKLYTKLPAWFKVPTPLGDYNPDWAIIYEKDNAEKLYFITESKGTVFDEDLRPTEKAKIECGKKHFNAMNSRLVLAHRFEDIVDSV